MASKNSYFLVTCLTITAILAWTFSVFTDYFADFSPDHSSVARINRELQTERFHRALAESRLRDFSEEVATMLPPGDEKKLAARGFGLSTLGEIVREPASEPLDLSGVLFERGKRAFGEKNWLGAMDEFQRLITTYPLSPHLVEAHFLYGEAAFLGGKAKECLETVDTMVTHFPENDLTGFLMLRMGQISESESRTEEAVEVYRTVQLNFHTPALREQARRLASATDTQ